LSGQQLIDRRTRGVCLDCGIHRPPLDDETGFPKLRCADCELRRRDQAAAEKKAALKAKRLKR